MIRKSIVRTLASTTIHAVKVSMDGDNAVVEKLTPVVVLGKANEKEMQKALKEKYGKDMLGLTVSNVEYGEDTYKISVDDFIKYATKIEKKQEENVNE